MLNLFFGEPDMDRWLPYDRYPRSIIRRLVRGCPSPGGQMRVYLNLKKGLDLLGIDYRDNDYRYQRKHLDELVCLIGKTFLLDRFKKSPILFGSSVFSHPSGRPCLFEEYPIKHMLVPGEWCQKMFAEYYGNNNVSAWPVGIDTEFWQPAEKKKTTDILVYNKIRWDKEQQHKIILNPIIEFLQKKGIKTELIAYGKYREEQFVSMLKRTKSVIFLCEHETQGLACEQIMSCNIPVFVWDRGGAWTDPEFYPKVLFAPVSTVPYWDDRCGMKFTDFEEFKQLFECFWENLKNFSPRSYILDNLTLEKCAQKYYEIASRFQ